MSNPLEKFIVENRESFDSESPDPRVWEKINERMNPEAKQPAPVRSMPFRRWMAAAAVVLMLGIAAILYFALRRDKPVSELAENKPALVKPDSSRHAESLPADSSRQIAKKEVVVPSLLKTQDQTLLSPSHSDIQPEENNEKEMFYYAKLIEIKHEELKTLEKDEPLLYRQFSADVSKLDSVYHTLKIQLTDHSNREQVMEAMIANLQLQIGLLNRQLHIIKQIKHSKKSAYEKAYKSV